jgi:hypothetical protein
VLSWQEISEFFPYLGRVFLLEGKIRHYYLKAGWIQFVVLMLFCAINGNTLLSRIHYKVHTYNGGICVVTCGDVADKGFTDCVPIVFITRQLWLEGISPITLAVRNLPLNRNDIW